MPPTISEATIQQYEQDGAIILRDAIPLAWIERMRLAVDRILAAPGQYASDQPEAAGGRFYGDFFLWRHDPEFRAFIFESPLAELARQIMRSNKVNFFYEQLLVKEPGTAARTPWHQDLSYWPVGGWQICSVWVPFDLATPETGAVTYIKGSHLWGKLYKPRSFGSRPREVDGESIEMEEAPDIDARPQDFSFLTGILKPGDVFIHHANTLHGAPGNSSATSRRRALATRWTGDDAYFLERPANFLRGEKFRALRDVAPKAEFDPMDSELFPVVIAG
jgi:ectoine hydroxylase-related dioxygenase (phytanoyl-CoA dioxygenase family)